MFSSESNRTLGMAIHLMMCVVFAIVYALLWNLGLGSIGLLWGAIFGAGHWLVAGAMMGGIPMMHAGIFMLNRGGMMAFMGGMMGHIIFGLMLVATYVHLIVNDPALFPLQPTEPIIPVVAIVAAVYVLWRGGGAWSADLKWSNHGI